MLRAPRLPACLAALLVATLAACADELPPPPPPPPPPLPMEVAAAPRLPLQVAGAVAAGAQPSGPAHRWRFDEPSGAVAKDSAGGEHGALGPGVVRIPGCAGNAVALAGEPRSVVELGQAAGAFGTRDFTVSLWFRTTTTKRNNELLSNRADGSHGNFFNLRFASSGVVVYELDEDTSGRGYVSLVSRPGLNDGVWHHVAARRQGPHAALFIDGARAADGKTGGVTRVDNGVPLRVGASAVAAQYDLYFQGAVDDVAIYDRALGDGEVASLAAGPEGCRPGAR